MQRRHELVDCVSSGLRDSGQSSRSHVCCCLVLIAAADLLGANRVDIVRTVVVHEKVRGSTNLSDDASWICRLIEAIAICLFHEILARESFNHINHPLILLLLIGAVAGGVAAIDTLASSAERRRHNGKVFVLEGAQR